MSNINQLPAELMSEIFVYLHAEDIFNCLFVSKRFYNIATSSNFIAPLYVNRGRFRLGSPSYRNSDLTRVRYFLAKFANGIIIDSLRFRFYQPQSLVGSDVVSFISLTGSYRIRQLYLEDLSCQLLSMMMSDEFGKLLFLRDLRLQMDTNTKLSLNSLQNLPRVAPNLESLEVARITDDLFVGTESFDNLKYICFNRSSAPNLLPAISSFVKKTPHLTGFACFQIDFEERSEEFFESLPNLEYICLALDSFFIPIKSPKLKELRIKFCSALQEQDQQQQRFPLSHVETFETVVDSDDILSCLKYYGIGDNLKTLHLSYWQHHEPHIGLETELWKRVPNLENLYSHQNSIDAEYLVNIAETCTNLRLVAFYSLLKEDEYTIASLADYGIKNIYLHVNLPEKETKFLLDNGINVHVVGYRYFSAWYDDEE